jgi:hypothetical protein
MPHVVSTAIGLRINRSIVRLLVDSVPYAHSTHILLTSAFGPLAGGLAIGTTTVMTTSANDTWSL